MNNFKKFLSFSKSERIAVTTITTIIVIILIIKYLITTNPPKKTYYLHDLDSIIALREKALEEAEAQKDKYQKVEFLSKNTQNNDKKYPKSTKNKPKDSLRVDKKPDFTPNSYKKEIKTIDINIADTMLLQTLPGIGATFASRIVRYRDQLGGYCTPTQLLDVFGMDTARYNGFKDYVFVDSLYNVKRLKINSEPFKTLLRHPYLEYEDVKKIVNYREQKGMISSWQQFVKVAGEEINPELKNYIDYE